MNFSSPLGLGLTATECKNVYAAGDMEYFKAAGCANTAANDQLLNAKKSELDLKTYALIGGGVLTTVLVIYWALK